MLELFECARSAEVPGRLCRLPLLAPEIQGIVHPHAFAKHVVIVGVQARGMAMAESMVPYQPMPEHIAAGRDRYYRTPIYVQEIMHRRATRKRNIPGI